MDEIVQQLSMFMFNDPTHGGMVALVLLICLSAIWLIDRKDKEYKTDMKEMLDQYQKQRDDNHKDLMEIIQKYQEGQISMIQALNEIKILLATVGAKL
jgi:hypothetical protein